MSSTPSSMESMAGSDGASMRNEKSVPGTMTCANENPESASACSPVLSRMMTACPIWLTWLASRSMSCDLPVPLFPTITQPLVIQFGSRKNSPPLPPASVIILPILTCEVRWERDAKHQASFHRAGLEYPALRELNPAVRTQRLLEDEPDLLATAVIAEDVATLRTLPER